jgi:hypothetical protein
MNNRPVGGGSSETWSHPIDTIIIIIINFLKALFTRTFQTFPKHKPEKLTNS